jgi:flagellin-like hook-associated protein FlgL
VFGQVNARISDVAKFKGPRVNRLQGIGLVVGLAGTTGGAGGLQINRLNFSDAILDLGVDGDIDPAATEFVGSEVGGVKVSGVFSALIELREALLVGDERDITKAAGKIDEALTDVTRLQGQLGAEVRAIESRGQQTQEAVEATTLLLSEVRDLDFAEAITRFQQTQTALQASLQASGQTLNLSLLSFLS